MEKIAVTSPLLPDLDELHVMMQDIWDKHWVTNIGVYHERLENALAEYLKVPYISLFTNGTIPLVTALQALEIRQGEVITTPFSFVATTHALWWNGLKPVFADIRESDCNLDPARIEEAITSQTKAILPVHVYGNPCDTEAIEDIARRHNLKVIYDAAHAFGVCRNGKSILAEGDMSTLSFHATKVYNTLEGGAIVCKTAQMKERIDHLRNFGFEDEVTVVGPGINGKMDEVRAAYGLLNLKKVESAIEKRTAVAKTYREALRNVKGIRMLEDIAGVRHNYAYFPVFVDAKEYGMTRDELYSHLKSNGILSRRYFYPLITSFETYSSIQSASPSNLPVANRIAESVICLPMHPYLTDKNIEKILTLIAK